MTPAESVCACSPVQDMIHSHGEMRTEAPLCGTDSSRWVWRATSGQLSGNRPLSHLSQICFSPKYHLAKCLPLENLFHLFYFKHNRYFVFKEVKTRACTNKSIGICDLWAICIHIVGIFALRLWGGNHQIYLEVPWFEKVLKRAWHSNLALNER